jgi:hypothetical protein
MVEKINQDLMCVFEMPEVLERFARLGAEPMRMSPAQFARFVVAEISVIGWLASAVDSAPARLLALAIATAVLLGLGILLLHRQIQRRIDDIGKL